VPRQYQHKVLFWGILGAIVFRAIFIFAGVELIKMTYLPAMNLFGQLVEINAILTIFGFFLIYAGLKSWFSNDDEEEKDFSKNLGARLINKFYTVSPTYDGGKFFTVKNGVKMATPLLVVVAIIEFTDLIFAIDSIPAIFAIAPDDPFILYTSNIFAILGLRSLYFLLANSLHLFSRLKYGVAIILAFIGIKMIISPFYHFSSTLSLSIVFGILALSIIASIISPIKNK
jgi:tellurite resistance protein TerC